MYKYTTDEVENTYFIDTKPFRFYLEIANRNGEAFNKVVKFQSRSVDANGNANVSGIENVDADNKAEYIFDLHGRRVAKPVVGVVYIVNGKKVIYTNK